MSPRPISFDREAFLGAVRSGAPIAEAAKRIGVGRETVQAHARRDPALREALDAAMRAGRAARVASRQPPARPDVLSVPREHDTRPFLKPEQVCEALTVAADAAHEHFRIALSGRAPRWNALQAYGPLRQTFHTLPDAERRELLARLLGEEGERIRHDRGAGFQHIATGRRRSGGDD